MTKHTYHGCTFSLITGDELGARMDDIQDRWGPDWRDDPVKRLVMDTFNSCQHFIDHYEDAARMRANNGTPPCQRLEGADTREMLVVAPQPSHSDHAKAVHKLAASLICPPAADDEPARLRAKGAL